jgi:hypothetical protein
MEAKSVKEERSVLSAAGIAALAGLLAGTALSLAMAGCAPATHQLQAVGGEDEPIVVAGGSMHIRAAKGRFDLNTGKAVYQHKAGHVTAIDVLYYDQAGPAFDRRQIDGAKTTVSLNYCDPGGSCAPATVETEADGHGLTFSPAGNDPMSDGNHQISHAPEDGHIDSLTVDQKTYGCQDSRGQKGRCTVVIHYCPAASCK